MGLNREKKFPLLARLLPIILVTMIGTGFPPPLAGSSDQQLFAPGIYVMLPPEQETEAGKVVTYIFRLENQTEETVTLKVKAASSLGWPLLGSSEELTLAPFRKEYVVYSLLIPATVVAGTTDQLYLTISGKEREEVFMVQTVVKAIRKIEWESRPLLRAQAGEELFFPVRLRNLGTTLERLDLEIQSDQGWPVSVSSAQHIIAPGQEGEVLIRCYVPEAVPADTLGEIHLRLRDAGPEIPALKLKILVNEALPGEREQALTIPVNATVSFNYAPPSRRSLLPWNLTWRTTGNLFTDTRFDLFFSGTHDVQAPVAAFMGVTGEKWALRLGALSHNWNSPIPPPTYSSLLYFQDQRSIPWSLWLGPAQDGPTPRWWGTGIHLKQPDLQLSYLQNLEPDRSFQHALTATHQIYASPLYGWKLTTESALGLGDSPPLAQEGITLSFRDEKQEFLGQYKLGTDFYELTDFHEFSLAAYLYPPGEPAYSTGWTLRDETSPDHSYLLSNKLWSELSWGNYRFGYAYTARSDGELIELKASTTRRRPRSNLSLSATYSQEKLSSQRQIFLLSSNYQYRFTTNNYLETIYKETFTYSQGQRGRLPELGFRWRYADNRKPWNCFGLVQWNMSEMPFNQLSAFQAGLGAQTPSGTAWQLYAQLFYEEEISHYSLVFRLEHEDLYFLPSPWAGIYGKAFVDLNRNGLYDTGEPGLAGLPVFLNGSQAALSKEDGSWEIPLTGAGRQILDFPVYHQNYYTLEAKKELFTQRNKAISVLIPYFPPTEVQGRLFIDTNRNNRFDAGEKGLAGATIVIFDHNRQPVIEKSTTNDGAFFFTLLPGEYILELKEESFAGNYLLPEPLPFKVTTESPFKLSVAVTPVTKAIEFFGEEVIPRELLETYTEESW
ncbi:MAG TPA: hypothetical protein VIL83_05650 [Capillibacterium sp.]